MILYRTPGQVADPPAAHEHDRVLLEVVTDTGDVRGDLDAGREPHACDLAERRVRLLRGRRVDARAHASPLRRALQGRRLGLVSLGLSSVADELGDRGHARSFENFRAANVAVRDRSGGFGSRTSAGAEKYGIRPTIEVAARQREGSQASRSSGRSRQVPSVRVQRERWTGDSRFRRTAPETDSGKSGECKEMHDRLVHATRCGAVAPTRLSVGRSIIG